MEIPIPRVKIEMGFLPTASERLPKRTVPRWPAVSLMRKTNL